MDIFIFICWEAGKCSGLRGRMETYNRKERIGEYIMGKGPVVRKRDSESVNSLLKRFRRACNKAGIKNELKKRRFYISPSENRNIEKSREKRRKIKDRHKENIKHKRLKTKKRQG